MIYIDYVGKYNSYTGTLEGDTWKITSTSINSIYSSIREFKSGSLTTKIKPYIITVEITSELGKSIKFDVDVGYTTTIRNKQENSSYYYLEDELKTSNYVHFKIGSSNKNVIIYSRDDADCKIIQSKKLFNFLKNEMNSVTEYFNKVEEIEKKKESIEKDFK